MLHLKFLRITESCRAATGTTHSWYWHSWWAGHRKSQHCSQFSPLPAIKSVRRGRISHSCSVARESSMASQALASSSTGRACQVRHQCWNPYYINAMAYPTAYHCRPGQCAAQAAARPSQPLQGQQLVSNSCGCRQQQR